jgi:hypothetical protein
LPSRPAIVEAGFVPCTKYDNKRTYNDELKDVLRHVETWPEAAPTELGELALEVDAELAVAEYRATATEFDGIDRGSRSAREIEELFKKH